MTTLPPSNFEETEAQQSTGFHQLAEPVKRWIWKRGWSELRSVQERAIPPILRSRSDVIIAAPTAGGKTEAAFLPLISQMVDDPPGRAGFRILYVSPLKALINDQFSRLDALCEDLEIPVHRWHGDVSASKKAQARKNPSGILLITPESLEALFVLRGLELPSLFAGLRTVVIDELHAFIGSERGIHLSSLLARLEALVDRKVRRIGLSATLGDIGLAANYMRPRPNVGAATSDIQLVEDRSEGAELKLQLKAFISGSSETEAAGSQRSAEDPEKTEGDGGADSRIANHLYKHLRGHTNLVFAGSRQNVERFSDLLSRRSDALALPNEFFAHHANLSRSHREFLEERLKQGRLPTTAVATSTLELGIDIGDVHSVAQIGPPASVASLRQRMGRSGRREGQPAILRAYVRENGLDSTSHPCDRLRLSLLQATAVIELMLEGWVEPPRKQALNMSTLVHQILSVIAQRGGTSAKVLHQTLCERGPFRSVGIQMFAQLLRHLGSHDVGMIEQSADGTLLLGQQGERAVEHYSFFASFITPEEYRIEASGKLLGTLPIESVLARGMTLIFAGRRWQVIDVRDREKVIEVRPDPTGVPPRFGGDPESIHDTVAQRMRQILADGELPSYLDSSAQDALADACEYAVALLGEGSGLIALDGGGTLIIPWMGSTAVETLALALVSKGIDASVSSLSRLVIQCEASVDTVAGMLAHLAHGPPPDGSDLAALILNKQTEKFHSVLSDNLLAMDIASSRLVADQVPAIASFLLRACD
jgi:ATP-dependent Lhr-like helicase